jgi:hypothetical protein
MIGAHTFAAVRIGDASLSKTMIVVRIHGNRQIEESIVAVVWPKGHLGFETLPDRSCAYGL